MKYVYIFTLFAVPLFLSGCHAPQESTQVLPDGTSTSTNETSQNNIDTSDWKTYVNEEYGFSFRYPEEWIVQSSPKRITLLSPELAKTMQEVRPTVGYDIWITVDDLIYGEDVNEPELLLQVLAKDKKVKNIERTDSNIVSYQVLNELFSSYEQHVVLFTDVGHIVT